MNTGSADPLCPNQSISNIEKDVFDSMNNNHDKEHESDSRISKFLRKSSSGENKDKKIQSSKNVKPINESYLCFIEQACEQKFISERTQCGYYKVNRSLGEAIEKRRGELPLCSASNYGKPEVVGASSGRWLVTCQKPCRDIAPLVKGSVQESKKDVHLNSCNWAEAEYFRDSCNARDFVSFQNEFTKCIEKKTFLFVGDSTLREVMNGVIDAVGYAPTPENHHSKYDLSSRGVGLFFDYSNFGTLDVADSIDYLLDTVPDRYLQADREVVLVVGGITMNAERVEELYTWVNSETTFYSSDVKKTSKDAISGKSKDVNTYQAVKQQKMIDNDALLEAVDKAIESIRYFNSGFQSPSNASNTTGNVEEDELNASQLLDKLFPHKGSVLDVRRKIVNNSSETNESNMFILGDETKKTLQGFDDPVDKEIDRALANDLGGGEMSLEDVVKKENLLRLLKRKKLSELNRESLRSEDVGEEEEILVTKMGDNKQGVTEATKTNVVNAENEISRGKNASGDNGSVVKKRGYRRFRRGYKEREAKIKKDKLDWKESKKIRESKFDFNLKVIVKARGFQAVS